MSSGKPYIFVGSTKESVRVAEAIQENLHDEAFCVPWHQGIFALSKSNIEALLNELDKADYAIFVFAADDIVRIRDHNYSAARDSVLFEFGLFTGRLGPNRAFFVIPTDAEDLRIPTDLLGVTAATYDSRDLQRNALAALGPACNQVRRALGGIRSRSSGDSFLHSRKELPPFGEWQPSRDAKDIWLIGQNLYMAFRNKTFFEHKLQSGTRIRCLIANYRDQELIAIMSKGVVESNNTRPDFVPALKTLTDLKKSLVDKSLLELKTMDYVPTLSFQVIDGESSSGTILVEMTPNRTAVTERPHFVLRASDVAMRPWYELFLSNCRQMFRDGQEWDWSLSW